MIGGAVVFGWWQSWGSWQELRSDWRDFRAAAIGARENRRERRAFAERPLLQPLSRIAGAKAPLPRCAPRPADAVGASWVYRCRCGEVTVYDSAGVGHHLEPSSAA